MLTICRLMALLATLVMIAPSTATAAVTRIWAVNDGEKVERDDRNNPNQAANSVWDGQKIRLFGAHNEVLAFQVIVEAGRGGIAKLDVRLPELARAGGGRIAYTPPVADPTRYAGRPIQLFSVHYMQVTEPSRASWIYRPDTPAAPKRPTGWKPVQLVPENARAGRGGFPLPVAEGQNQPIWIEIYTAKSLPAGLYSGSLAVNADGQRTILPVELELFDFTLPDENSMRAMVYYEGSQPEEYQGRNLDAAYHRFAHRNRVELVHAYTEERVRAAMGRFRGTDFTKAQGYEGPGEGVGNSIVPATFYGPGPDFDEKASAWRRSDAWISFLKTTLPGAFTFLYLPDEPRPAEFPHIRQIAENLHSNPGPGRQLRTFVTRGYSADLDGAIDIWCSGPRAYRLDKAREERAKGHDYWIYNGGRPAGGAFVMEAPATDPRMTIWACFKGEIPGYFYWHGVHWRHNHQKAGEKIQNVWANPITFDSRQPGGRGSFANGDGVLIYPGEEKLHPEEDRGIAGPCSTIQLANLRRGLQDHQYLTLARKLGQTELVDRLVQRLVPRVLAEATGEVGFAESGNDYEEARLALAKAIVVAQAEKAKP